MVFAQTDLLLRDKKEAHWDRAAFRVEKDLLAEKKLPIADGQSLDDALESAYKIGMRLSGGLMRFWVTHTKTGKLLYIKYIKDKNKNTDENVEKLLKGLIDNSFVRSKKTKEPAFRTRTVYFYDR